MISSLFLSFSLSAFLSFSLSLSFSPSLLRLLPPESDLGILGGKKVEDGGQRGRGQAGRGRRIMNRLRRRNLHSRPVAPPRHRRGGARRPAPEAEASMSRTRQSTIRCDQNRLLDQRQCAKRNFTL